MTKYQVFKSMSVEELASWGVMRMAMEDVLMPEFISKFSGKRFDTITACIQHNISFLLSGAL